MDFNWTSSHLFTSAADFKPTIRWLTIKQIASTDCGLTHKSTWLHILFYSWDSMQCSSESQNNFSRSKRIKISTIFCQPSAAMVKKNKRNKWCWIAGFWDKLGAVYSKQISHSFTHCERSSLYPTVSFPHSRFLLKNINQPLYTISWPRWSVFWRGLCFLCITFGFQIVGLQDKFDKKILLGREWHCIQSGIYCLVFSIWY